jgi:hypothetical protein
VTKTGRWIYCTNVLFCTWAGLKVTVQRDHNSFLTSVDGPGLEYESLMVLTFFKRPLQCWIIVRNFNVVKDNSFWKNFIFGIFFLNRIKPFRGFFSKANKLFWKGSSKSKKLFGKKKGKSAQFISDFPKR